MTKDQLTTVQRLLGEAHQEMQLLKAAWGRTREAGGESAQLREAFRVQLVATRAAWARLRAVLPDPPGTDSSPSC